MTEVLKLHFLLLAIGEVLKSDDFVDAQKLQNFITNDEAFGGFRVPLGDCRLALTLMENSGFIVESLHEGEGKYVRDTHLLDKTIKELANYYE